MFYNTKINSKNLCILRYLLTYINFYRENAVKWNRFVTFLQYKGCKMTGVQFFLLMMCLGLVSVCQILVRAEMKSDIGKNKARSF